MRASMCILVIGLFLVTIGYANQVKVPCNQQSLNQDTPMVYDKLLEGSPLPWNFKIQTTDTM